MLCRQTMESFDISNLWIYGLKYPRTSRSVWNYTRIRLIEIVAIQINKLNCIIFIRKITFCIGLLKTIRVENKILLFFFSHRSPVHFFFPLLLFLFFLPTPPLPFFYPLPLLLFLLSPHLPFFSSLLLFLFSPRSPSSFFSSPPFIFSHRSPIPFFLLPTLPFSPLPSPFIFSPSPPFFFPSPFSLLFYIICIQMR